MARTLPPSMALSGVPQRAEAFLVREGFDSQRCGWSGFKGGSSRCIPQPKADLPIWAGTLEARYHRGQRLGHGLVLSSTTINRMDGFAALPGQTIGTGTTLTHTVRTLVPVAMLSNGPAVIQLGPAVFRTRGTLRAEARRLSEGNTSPPPVSRPSPPSHHPSGPDSHGAFSTSASPACRPRHPRLFGTLHGQTPRPISLPPP